MRWFRRRWVWQLVAYVAVIATFGYILNEQHRHNEIQCIDRQAGRDALRTVIIVAFREGSPVDIGAVVAAVPSAEDVDPTIQRFITEVLGELTSASDPRRDAIRNEILATIPPVTCE